MGFSHQRQAAARTVLRARATNDQSAIDDAEAAVSGYFSDDEYLNEYIAEHYPNGLDHDPSSPVFGKDELLELHSVASAAQAVLPAPWIRMNATTVSVVERSPRDGSITGGGEVATANTDQYAKHIVTFEPAIVLRLIDAIEVSNRFS